MTGLSRGGRRTWPAGRRTLGAALASLLVLAGCSTGSGAAGSGDPTSGAGHSTSGASHPASTVSDPTSSAARANGALSCPRRVLAGMSLPQRVGQLFVVGVQGAQPTPAELRLVRRRHVGGVILMGSDTVGVAATARVARTLQRHATSDGVSLWVATDQEGGQVQRLKGPGFSDIPEALTQGTLRPAVLRRLARGWGGELHRAGVNMNLAPVLDTVPAALGEANAPIGRFHREFGHTPGRVARHGTAFLEGMRAAGVTPVVKHFPGLGRVRRNTDTSRNVVDDTTTRTDPFLRPFRAAVRDGVRVVMVSSARYRRIDPAHLAPFSRTVLHGMLRHDLGFTGVIMTDDFAIAKALSGVPLRARAVRFLSAGGSVVLAVDAATVPPMLEGVLQRARADRAFRHRVDTEALRVLVAKDAAGLLPCS